VAGQGAAPREHVVVATVDGFQLVFAVLIADKVGEGNGAVKFDGMSQAVWRSWVEM
jgi:hypothetical protein